MGTKKEVTGIQEDRMLSHRQKDGMDYANDPSRHNPCATMRDLEKVGVKAVPGFIQGQNIEFLTTTTLRVTPGIANSTTKSHIIDLSAPYNLNFGVTGLGGLDVGAIQANQWYHVFSIANPGQQTENVLASLSYTPTLPGNFTEYRRCGSVRVNGSSNMLRFRQYGLQSQRKMYYEEDHEVALRLLASGNDIIWTSISTATLIPPTSQLGLFYIRQEQVGGKADFRPFGQTSGSYIDLHDVQTMSSEMPTDASQIVEYIAAAINNSAYLSVLGYQEWLS